MPDRVAVYARYSSDMQSPASIPDQVAAARRYAEQQGWIVAEVYTDAAISGATLAGRPDMQRLIADARAGRFDVLLTESLDRISRTAEHQHHVYSQMQFAGVRVVTLADGDIGPLHVGIKGTMAAMQLDDLARKVRRGHEGRVRAGRVACGKPPYGYLNSSNLGDLGQREIVPEQAEIVRRIFAEYVSGLSPGAIAKRLNQDGVPSPDGRLWAAPVIRGASRVTGILNQEMYRGRLVYGKRENARDPSSQKKVSRKSTRDLITGDAPHLRIIADATWDAAQAAMAERTRMPGPAARRPSNLLSGIVRCGVCGGAYVVTSGLASAGSYLGCKTRKLLGSCSNKRTVSRREVERRALAQLTEQLLDPDVLSAAVEAYRERRRERSRQLRSIASNLRRDFADTERKIANLEAVIEAGGDAQALARRYNSLVMERDRLRAALSEAQSDAVIDLHPRALDRLREAIEQLPQLAGETSPDALKAMSIVRQIIDKVEIHPTPRGKPVEIRVLGEIEALLDEAVEVAAAPQRRGQGS